jgi:cytochrome c biogenesis protein
MRTAIILLLLLAAASVAGSLLPQVPNSPQRVAAYRIDHPSWGDLFWSGGFFDVFGSWWFGLITALLFVSLVACLLPRSRALIRAIRQRPIQARELDAFPSFAEQRVAVAPEDVARAAADVLRRKRFRVERDGVSVAAEKGAMRELGSLAFHWGFLVLLIAVIVGKGTGYSGFATVVEGESWTDARLNFAGELRTGRYFAERFSGTQITLLDFQDAYRETGAPMDFRSTVLLAGPDDASSSETEVGINHPISFNGIRIFQYGFGWAPWITIRKGERLLFDGAVVMGQEVPPGGNPLATPWLGVVKLPTLRPQQAVVLELYPDAEAYFRALETGVPQPMTEPNAPFMRYQVWEGRLLDPSLSGLDTRSMRETGSGLMGEGWTVNLDAGCAITGPEGDLPRNLVGVSCPETSGSRTLTMSFPRLRQYSRFQITRDATVPYVLAAAILILAGLLPALYVSRRKIWVRAVADGDGALVQIGGFALQRKDRFADEFEAVVTAVVRAAGGRIEGRPQEVTT